MSRPRPRARALVALCVVLPLALVGACSLPDGAGPGAAGPAEPVDVDDLTFAVITHAGAGDEFWDRVQSGARQAGADYDVTVQYTSAADPGSQSLLIDQAVASNVDGIVVSMANPDGLETSVRQAVAAGIPVVSINSGLDDWQRLGAITHIGQSESIAGRAAGARLAEEGATNALCVIHEAGNVGLQQRCAAAAEAMGGRMRNLQVDVSNATAVAATITASLQQDPTIDAVLTLQGAVAVQAVQAAREAGSAAAIATFDLSTDVVEAVIHGRIAFAVDQQPFVQGYLGVTALYLRALNGNDVGGGEPVYSGPAFVTQENAEQVLRFAARGTR
ncbi:periplasmic binding protein/LacI transcriptional regulator [Xylanimonas cellulosilytica DSM 15894]|uniref:Periplasmic binding protein/LacI transcriptional regulator n=1 Tax=Xylanimonas cellulosilytica (strain DSM 15894 / JCM 12276 / CECT 5975 / KCTC 9989 / LMG 20990 / NBRC 107835 / XIL07) TaxID=446471 RepID=D1BWE1_XYLCX|nr:substrate-binding domain-containing protein [Xylanimonas cellulosilytica]ACZ31486.1 periplasmic binding protein/LacI transcriptional regulator [Xylanimonas cellulosilytica DSM 15894]